MDAFTTLSGLVAPLDRANVDTDAIIPKQYLKSLKRTGFGAVLFDEWRYLDQGDLTSDHAKRRANPDFVLNDARYAGAKILLARRNFGCGSSREHAAWALRDYGFRCVIAPSFADIFFNNCMKNGMLPVALDDARVDALFAAVESQPGYALSVDLPSQKITAPDSEEIPFEIEAAQKHRLLNGLDDIALTLEHADLIRQYEDRRKKEAPWLFGRVA
ncbi:MAG: 3-isopropylmalate dehydratase small subunit [Gammaproteobacteria bacterium]|nr:3-isopropylmalate dehydratase small subunit [Gammaproteobacteria bacterium]CAJ2377525.1 MAG: 3-isopropylmalate dehydratase subunit LeuD [Arenicellales bacterium IbO2]MDA7961159.1 3-isopropylmalate dehydratase small subunit [Gammaproteobacteria bacterium]MDA7970541.1 3-isopropylmalate dehydratase small subunit [Gammaproteobacteria bacterium]MDA7994822.1 3-isopropylmalate dehydratase small subunit [Gammaproteobacteria bacterium]